MREAIGSYWLTIIVITFIVVFSGYICLSINMNKAYKVKNQIINIIQKNNGLNGDALDQIQEYMTKVGYRTTGKCNDTDGSGFSINSDGPTENNTVFCAKEMRTSYYNDFDVTPQFPEAAYYQIKVFFAVDLPLFRDIFVFQISGSTKKLYYPVTFTS